MSTTTTNYGLIKPDTTDPILIGQLNDNSDAIDAALKENADAIENKPDAADIPSPSTAAPAMDGTAAAGTSTDYARADHIHPSDTSKQDALSAAQLAAANSGIDSAKVEQIETNKNNISFINQKVGVNLVNSASGSGVRWINIEVDLPAGTYTCGFDSLTGDDSGVSQVTFYGADYAVIQPERSKISKGNNVYVNNIVVTGAVKIIRIYAASDSTTSQNQGVSYTNLFVCKQEAWDASVGVQPYAMSNAELTAAIQAIQARLAALEGNT